MKTILALSCLALLLLTGSAQAQPPADAQGLVAFNAAYSTSKIKDYDEYYPGWGLGLALDRMIKPSKFSLGATLSYVGGRKELQNEKTENLKVTSSYTALPIAITGKFYFGGEKIFGYLGAGVGAHIGTLRNSIEDPTDGSFESNEQRVTSFSFAVPLGVYVLVGNKTYLNLGYLPYFVVENDIVDGATHTFVLGVVGNM